MNVEHYWIVVMTFSMEPLLVLKASKARNSLVLTLLTMRPAPHGRNPYFTALMQKGGHD